MSKIKIGLIGCGKQAPKHISGLSIDPEVDIVLADVDSHLAQDLGAKKGLAWVHSPDDIFDDPDISAVDICTPTHTHFSLIQQAVRSGKDFFCEKPLCNTIEEARRIDDLVKECNRIGMVGYVYRFAPIYNTASSLFKAVPETGESDALGRVVSAYFRIGGRGSHEVWKHRKDTSGGAIREMLVHMVDLAIWYFGQIELVEVISIKLLRPQRLIRGKIETVDAEDYVLVKLMPKHDTEIFLQADLITPAFSQYVEIQGENGSFMGSIQSDRPNFVFLSEGKDGYPVGMTEFKFGQVDLFKPQMSEFIASIRERRQPNRCTIADSLLVMETMAKIENFGM